MCFPSRVVIKGTPFFPPASVKGAELEERGSEHRAARHEPTRIADAMCYGTALPTRDGALTEDVTLAFETDAFWGACTSGLTSFEARAGWGCSPAGHEEQKESVQQCQQYWRTAMLETENTELRERLREMKAAESVRANALEAENRELRVRLGALSRELDEFRCAQRSPGDLPGVAPHVGRPPAGSSRSESVVSTVFPRRKPGDTKRDCSAVAPVALSLEVLEQLANYSLPHAASKLGISATAMKKACRKLGIARWPYLPARPGRHFEAASAPPSMSAPSSMIATELAQPKQAAMDVTPPPPEPPGPVAKEDVSTVRKELQQGAAELVREDSSSLQRFNYPQSPSPLADYFWGGFRQ